MSDLDERGFYVGDEDERQEALEARRSKRFKGACRCGTDMPGRCPGPENCPMCQEEEEKPLRRNTGPFGRAYLSPDGAAMPVASPLKGAALPCPFCGSTRIETKEGSTYRWWLAYCVDCDAAAGEIRADHLRFPKHADDLAISEWNQRAPTAKGAA